MPDTLTKERVVGDFVRSFPSMAYCIGSRFVHNASAAEVELRTLAVPAVKATVGGVDVYQIVFAGAEATADAFLVEDHNETLAAAGNSKMKRAGLERGWAVVSREALPATDPAGAAYDLDALEARFATMDPPVMVSDNTGNRELKNLLRS